jgi:hypothetical protein
MNTPDPADFLAVSRLNDSVARLLRRAALVLALLFLLRVLLPLGPLRSGPLPVLLRFCDGLVSQAPLAVMAACLIGLSLLLDAECRSSQRLARGLRAAALPVAFGYLLLIPLYGSAQWWRSRAEATALRQGLQASLERLQSTRRSVQQTSSTEQLARIWTTLPTGSPPLARFGSNTHQQRTGVVRFLDQLSGILQARLAGLDRKLLFAVVHNTGLFGLACLGLAALFYRSSQLDLPGWPLRHLTEDRPPPRQRWLGRRHRRMQQDVEWLLQLQYRDALPADTLLHDSVSEPSAADPGIGPSEDMTPPPLPPQRG